MTDEDAISLGYHYKVAGIYARTAAEANAVQRRFHSHFNEAPEVELLQPEPTVQDSIQASLERRC